MVDIVLVDGSHVQARVEWPTPCAETWNNCLLSCDRSSRYIFYEAGRHSPAKRCQAPIQSTFSFSKHITYEKMSLATVERRGHHFEGIGNDRVLFKYRV